MTKFNHYTILFEIIISIMFSSAFAIPKGSKNGVDTIMVEVTVYDHYAMNDTDMGYFEFNPMASGESEPGICEERVQGMVQQTLGPDGLPRANQYIPCAYNMNLNNWFKADPDNSDPKYLVFPIYLGSNNYSLLGG